MCSSCGGLLTGFAFGIATLTSFLLILLGGLLQALTDWIYTKFKREHGSI